MDHFNDRGVKVTLLHFKGVESGTHKIANLVRGDELEWFIEVGTADELIEGTARHLAPTAVPSSPKDICNISLLNPSKMPSFSSLENICFPSLNHD